MQILFEDLTLQETQVVVDALDNHRKLVAKLEQEAEQEMIERRAEMERALEGVLEDWKEREVYSKVVVCNCGDTSFLLENLSKQELNLMLGLCWGCNELGHRVTAEEVKQWYLNRKQKQVWVGTHPTNGLIGHYKTIPASSFHPGPAGALRIENVSPELAEELGRVGLAGAAAGREIQNNKVEFWTSPELLESAAKWAEEDVAGEIHKAAEASRKAVEQLAENLYNAHDKQADRELREKVVVVADKLWEEYQRWIEQTGYVHTSFGAWQQLLAAECGSSVSDPSWTWWGVKDGKYYGEEDAED